MASEGVERASERAGIASKGDGRASEGAGWASEGAGSASEEAGRASERVERTWNSFRGRVEVSEGAEKALKGTISCRSQTNYRGTPL